MTDPLGDYIQIVQCHQCGFEVEKSLARLEADKSLACTACDYITEFDAETLREFRDMAASLAEPGHDGSHVSQEGLDL